MAQTKQIKKSKQETARDRVAKALHDIPETTL